LVFLSSCFPEGSIVRRPFVISPILLSQCVTNQPKFCFLFIHLHLLGPVAFHKSLSDIVLGHHIVKIYVRQRLKLFVFIAEFHL
jgi:hypothetical protein